MSTVSAAPGVLAPAPLVSARRLLAAALVAALAAVGLAMAQPYVAAPAPLRVVLIVAAAILALGGVNARFRTAGLAADERAATAGVLALAAFIALLGYLAADPDWFSFRLLLGALVLAGLVGAVLMLLPQALRRALIVLLVVFHFGGILTAVFSVPPPNAPVCWLTTALWTYIYRPYLQFLYLNNAYHFYSPEPGPATLLWFRVQYADGTAEWVKIPNREDFHSRLQYQRRLALTESTNMNAPAPNPQDFDQALVKRNFYAAQMTHPIPLHPELPPGSQYREPTAYSKKMIASYARHVARDPEYHKAADPNQPVTSVKVYRVVHNIIMARDLARGLDPRNEILYTPYYMGEFDPDGTLKNPKDPMLYWLVPILRAAKSQPPGGAVTPDMDTQLWDFLAYHAGDVRDPKDTPAAPRGRSEQGGHN